MELDLLYIFTKVAESKSINQVSDSLLLTQPAISKKIQQLESEFDTKLFIRSSRGMTLTSDGKKLYKQIVPFLEQFEGIKNSIAHSSNAFNTAKIGVLDSISSYKYPQFFADNLDKFQEIIISNKIFDLIDPFNQGQLDVLIIDSAFKNYFEGHYSEQELYSEPYYVISSKSNHKISKLSKIISPQELQSMNLIMYPKYCPIHQRIVQTYQNIDLQPPRIMEIDYSESTISMVTNSEYVTVLPEAMARNKVKQDKSHLAMHKLDMTFERKVSLFAREKKRIKYFNELK